MKRFKQFLEEGVLKTYTRKKFFKFLRQFEPVKHQLQLSKDKHTNKKIKNMLDVLKKYLKSNDKTFTQRFNDVGALMFPTSANLDIALLSREFVLENDLPRLPEFNVIKGEKKTAISLPFMMDNLPYKSLHDVCVEHFNLLVHEFTHYLQFMNPRDNLPDTSVGDSEEIHFTDEKELDAYYQMILYDVDDLFERAERQNWKKEMIKEGFDAMWDNIIEDNFKYILKNLSSENILIIKKKIKVHWKNWVKN